MRDTGYFVVALVIWTFVILSAEIITETVTLPRRELPVAEYVPLAYSRAGAPGWLVAVDAGVGERTGVAAVAGVEVATRAVVAAGSGVLVGGATSVDVAPAAEDCVVGLAGADAPTTTVGWLVESGAETVSVETRLIHGSPAASTARPLAAGRVDNSPAT